MNKLEFPSCLRNNLEIFLLCKQGDNVFDILLQAIYVFCLGLMAINIFLFSLAKFFC